MVLKTPFDSWTAGARAGSEKLIVLAMNLKTWNEEVMSNAVPKPV